MTLYKPHPWHGISLGEEAPRIVTCFIEIVPTDTVKYEVDKATGYLKVDRPQKFSNVCPALYGMLPQTYCGARVGGYCAERSGRPIASGDGDPMDAIAGSAQMTAGVRVASLLDKGMRDGERWFRVVKSNLGRIDTQGC